MTTDAMPAESTPRDWRWPGVMALLCALHFTFVASAAAVYLAASFSFAIFVVVPLTGGLVNGLVYNFFTPKGAGRSVGMAVVACLASLCFLLLGGIEGLTCLAMAAPLAVPLYVAGALLGLLVCHTWRAPGSRVLPLVLAPLCAFALMGMEYARGPKPAERAVHSAVIVNATPEALWQVVVAFPTIPAPEDWLFRTGIAYPTHAEIDGEGVGAVRRCHFSTGAFVEPITHWEPPQRLAFDVTKQPHPMREWSPYPNLHPPHLDTGLRAHRGEFRIVPLGDGTTRLEGTTWYSTAYAPEAYWGWMSDAIIHAIHLRVLEHIRQHAEHAG